MFSALPLTGTAELFLLPIGRSTVAYKCIALTMRTMNGDRYHGILPLSTCCRYSTTSLSFWPLPVFLRLPLRASTYSPSCSLLCLAILGWQPIASILTRQPATSNCSNSAGSAACPLAYSATYHWAKTRHCGANRHALIACRTQVRPDACRSRPARGASSAPEVTPFDERGFPPARP